MTWASVMPTCRLRTLPPLAHAKVASTTTTAIHRATITPSLEAHRRAGQVVHNGAALPEPPCRGLDPPDAASSLDTGTLVVVRFAFRQGRVANELTWADGMPPVWGIPSPCGRLPSSGLSWECDPCS